MTDPLAPAVPDPRAARRCLAIMVGGMLAIGLGLGAFAWSLGPPTGDLVRTGAKSSRQFGWRGVAQGFARDHYTPVTLEALLAGAPPGDILIFGDSFSLPRPGGISWINTLHARTGREIRFVRIFNFAGLARYLGSSAFAAAPPRALILETVERALMRRAVAEHDPDRPCPAPGPARRLRAAAPGDPARVVLRPRAGFEGIDELLSWGALAARLRLSGEQGVLEVRLTRSDLFSHAASGRVLLLGEDVTRHLPAAFAPGGVAQAARAARCGLRQIAAAAGWVPFRLVVAPDKRTVYAPWLADPLPAKALDPIALARHALGERFVDLAGPMRAAAAAGRRDLYWPNDTHWGAAGHRLAGARIARALAEPALNAPGGDDRRRATPAVEETGER